MSDLLEAVICRDLPKIKTLVLEGENGLDEPLLYAAAECDIDVVKMLLDSVDADIDCEDCYGETPIFQVVRSNASNADKIKLLKVMIKNNADCGHKNNDNEAIGDVIEFEGELEELGEVFGIESGNNHPFWGESNLNNLEDIYFNEQ